MGFGSRVATVGVVAALVAATLAGCSAEFGAGMGESVGLAARDAGAAQSPGAQGPAAPGPAAPDSPPPAPPQLEVGVTDWANLETCDDDVSGATGTWTRTSGYPEAEFDEALIVASCGYRETEDGDYVGVAAIVDDNAIYSLGGQLTRDGWVLQSDDFDPDLAPASGEYAGSRDYVSAGGDLLHIETYDNGTLPTTFQTYFDFSTPDLGQPT